eukprot:COSAG01_NODE_59876_length_297_cov_3.035354_1_plen_39_part_10
MLPTDALLTGLAVGIGYTYNNACQCARLCTFAQLHGFAE